MKRTFKIKLLIIEIWFCYLFTKKTNTADFSISLELPERIKKMLWPTIEAEKTTSKQNGKLKKIA
jgi:hypothetical protein